MRFNFISDSGDGMALAHRVLEEDNEVRLWIEDEQAGAIGEGLVPKVEVLEELVYGAKQSSDIFIFDGSGDGVLADGLRCRGFGVVGGSILADRLERDRGFAREVMEFSGIRTPISQTFTDWETGIEFARRNKRRLVYKPSKNLGEESPSQVTNDSEELVELLENLKERVRAGKIEFDLQAFEEGLEISSEGWFDGSRFLPLFNHTFERKQLMPGNLGPSGGCTGNIVWACDGQCDICRSGVRKLEQFLRSNGYRGPIDLNSIVGDRFYGLEFTPRFGYDAFPTLAFCLLEMELGQFFADLALGNSFNSNSLNADKLAAAIKISIPPWPLQSKQIMAEADVPIRFPEGNEENIYLYNVKKGEAGLASAGAWGLICLTLGVGSSVARAFSKPYELADGLRLRDKQYRNDLVSEFKKNVVELEEITGGILQHVG